MTTSALYERFASRGEADFADRIMSAQRFEFGGHHEKPAEGASEYGTAPDRYNRVTFAPVTAKALRLKVGRMTSSAPGGPAADSGGLHAHRVRRRCAPAPVPARW